MQLANHLTLKNRIWTGFGIILGCLLLVGGGGYVGFKSASANLQSYVTGSDNAIRVKEIMVEASDIRRNVMLFTERDDHTALERIHRIKEELKGNFAEAIRMTVAPERRANLEKMRQLLDLYLRNFDQVVSLTDNKSKIYHEELTPLGLQAVEKLTSLIDGMIRRGNWEAVAYAGRAQVQFLLVRVDAVKFFAEPSEQMHAQVAQQAASALAALQLAVDKEKDGTERAGLEQVTALLQRYRDAFEKLTADAVAANRIVSKDNAELATQFAEIGEKNAAAQMAVLNVLRDDSFARSKTNETVSLTVTMAALIVGLFFAARIARSVILPVKAMTSAMARLADGRLDTEIPARDRQDEIGAMAQSVQVFKESLIRVQLMEEEQAAQKRRAEDEHKALLREMADSFEAQVGSVMQTVTSNAIQLQASARQMAATAEKTSIEVTTVASASEQTSHNVQTVAAATEELSASIREIADQVERSLGVAQRADGQAKETSELVRRLADNVTSIGEIVALINDIASQTNLLALNATIEAARAGDSGKGFAVVASEVKNLANQTARATEEIAAKIGAVQSGTTDAVKAIEAITGVIEDLSGISASVASAVEQQAAATREISRNVDQAAVGTGEVSRSICGVETAARETGQAAAQISHSSTDLSDQANLLKREVARFLDEVRLDQGEAA